MFKIIIYTFITFAPGYNSQDLKSEIVTFRATKSMLYMLTGSQDMSSSRQFDAGAILFEAGGGLLGGSLLAAGGGIIGMLVVFLKTDAAHTDVKDMVKTYALWGGGIGYTIGVPIGIWQVGKLRGKEGGFLAALGLSVLGGIIGGYWSVKANSVFPIIPIPLAFGIAGYNLAAK